MRTRSLRLAAWKIERKTLEMEGISSNAAKPIPCPGDQVQLQVTNRPGTSELSGVANNKLMEYVRL